MAEGNDFHRRVRQRRQETNRRFAAFFLGVVILCMAFSFFFAMQSESMQRQYIYPYPYRSVVEHYAAKYKVDSSLVAGMILSESKFQSGAKSHRGAVGLMQLMPETALWISEQIDDQDYNPGELHGTSLRWKRSSRATKCWLWQRTMLDAAMCTIGWKKIIGAWIFVRFPPYLMRKRAPM